MVKQVREVDLVGRYGGEEIIILLPETDRPTSLQVAERLRTASAEMPIQVEDKEIRLTVIIEVATKHENTQQLETLIDCAGGSSNVHCQAQRAELCGNQQIKKMLDLVQASSKDFL